jgi:hypothetical protein
VSDCPGYGQAEDRARSVATGFAAHLVRPVEPERLMKTISRLRELAPTQVTVKTT